MEAPHGIFEMSLFHPAEALQSVDLAAGERRLPRQFRLVLQLVPQLTQGFAQDSQGERNVARDDTNVRVFQHRFDQLVQLARAQAVLHQLRVSGTQDQLALAVGEVFGRERPRQRETVLQFVDDGDS